MFCYTFYIAAVIASLICACMMSGGVVADAKASQVSLHFPCECVGLFVVVCHGLKGEKEKWLHETKLGFFLHGGLALSSK